MSLLSERFGRFNPEGSGELLSAFNERCPPGEISIRFVPGGGRNDCVQTILYEGQDIQKTGLTVEAGREIRGVKIVVATGGDR